MKSIESLHYPHLAAVAWRAWWRIASRPDVPPAYGAILDPSAHALRILSASSASVPGLPAARVEMLRSATEMAAASAVGRLLRVGDSVFRHRLDDACCSASRAMERNSKGFKLASDRRRHPASDGSWPSDPDGIARVVVDCWERSDPGTPAVLVALLQGASCLHRVARAEILAWRVAWQSGAHFKDFVFWPEHSAACDALRELSALGGLLDPRSKEAMQSDADRLLEMGPRIDREAEFPETLGHLDPSARGPLGPL